MDSQFAVIPAAIGMMLGPPILSAVVLATSDRARANSLVYVVGVALGATAGMVVAYASTWLFDQATDDLEQGDDLLTWIVVALLVFLSIRTFVRRKTAEPPAWMGKLQVAEPRLAFKLGLLLAALLPSNIIILVSAAAYLVDNDYALSQSFWLIGTTTLIAALPILAVATLGSRAETVMPAVREWMKEKSWLISIIVYVFFIFAMVS